MGSSYMDIEEVKVKLKEIALKKGEDTVTTKDLKNVEKLHYYVYQYYDSIADALDDVGIKSSKLSRRMRMSDEERLLILYRLGKSLGCRPRHKDINKAGYYKIFDKFGGIEEAWDKAVKMYEKNGKEKIVKESKKLPDIDYKGLFYGAAGEFYVISELLYHGFFAQKMLVDLGVDLYATKGEKVFFFQVKNLSFDKANIRKIEITKSSFTNERNVSTRVFYVFVIQKNNKKKSLVIDYLAMKKIQEQKYIYDKNDKKMYIAIKLSGDSVFIVNENSDVENKDMDYYLNAWHLIV